MRYTIAIPTLRGHAIPTTVRPRSARQLLLAAVVVAAGFATALVVRELPAIDPVAFVKSIVPAPVDRPLPPELPEEWRWRGPEPVRFDGMFMETDRRDKLDWIRTDDIPRP